MKGAVMDLKEVTELGRHHGWESAAFHAAYGGVPEPVDVRVQYASAHPDPDTVQSYYDAGFTEGVEDYENDQVYMTEDEYDDAREDFPDATAEQITEVVERRAREARNENTRPNQEEV